MKRVWAGVLCCVVGWGCENTASQPSALLAIPAAPSNSCYELPPNSRALVHACDATPGADYLDNSDPDPKKWKLIKSKAHRTLLEIHSNCGGVEKEWTPRAE